MDYKKSFLFLIILGVLIYIGNLYFNSFKSMGNNTKDNMIEYYSASKEVNSRIKKEEQPTPAKIEEPLKKEEPVPNAVPIQTLEEPVNQQEDYYPPPPEPPQEDNSGKLAVCISRMVHCQWSNIAFKYPSQENPRSVEKDNVEVECVTLGANCLNNNYQTISNEEANEIYNYYYNKFQQEEKQKKQAEQIQPVPEISNY